MTEAPHRLEILFLDNDIVVVNKPSGLLVHRSLLASDAHTFALQLVRDLLGRRVFPVHRLDRATSGALLFALTQEVAQSLAAQFAAGQVYKKYLLIVRGTPPAAGRIDYALREELDPLADRQSRREKPAQPAITDFRRLATYEFPMSVDKYPTARYSLVEAIPRTGRKHQIRRHLRHIGHPIIGDVTHGSGKHNRFFRSQLGVHRLLLACTELGFHHPRTQAWLQVAAPLDETFASLCESYFPVAIRLPSPAPDFVQPS